MLLAKVNTKEWILTDSSDSFWFVRLCECFSSSHTYFVSGGLLLI